MSTISYRKVSKAIKRYEKLGYRYIDTPWVVSEEAIRATLPPERQGFDLRNDTLNAGRLVGSAEQGYIQLMLDDKLPAGLYVTAGPCFRDEPVVDQHHQYAFFKVELIHLLRWNETLQPHSVQSVARDAEQVIYELYGPGAKVVKTPEGYDLEVEGVEIGSYGVRSFKNWTWVYGTGLALPRTPQAFKVRE